MLKELRWAAIARSVGLIVAGILLILYPDVSGEIITNIIGIGCAAIGLMNIFSYFLMDIQSALDRNEFITGMIAVVIGLVVIFKKDIFLNLVPVILGLVIVISGISKLQDGIVAKKIGYGGAMTYMILALISIVFGIVVMFVISGQLIGTILFTVIGVGLLYCGGTDLYATLFLSKKFHDFKREIRRREHEKQENIIDVSVEQKPEQSVQQEQEETHIEG